MKMYLIYTVLILFGLIIGYIILGDIFIDEQDQKNPYAYDLNRYREVDPSWIKYRETKRINTNIPEPRAIDYQKGLLVIGYKDHFQVIDTTGREYFNKPVDDWITSISFSPDGKIFLGCKNRIKVYENSGPLIDSWEITDSTAYITSITFRQNTVIIADAGGPGVHIFNHEGKKINSFDGTGRVDREKGFIVPSPYFDVAVGKNEQLWVANTGIQNLENYSGNGTLISYWGEPSFNLNGFIGCCNPAQFTMLSDGSFVTSEKGVVRIKVYTSQGELESVVATPDDFNFNSEPPDLTVDENDRIYALDISRNMIRKFERKSNG